MAKFDAKKADLNKDGKLSDYEKNRGEATAAAMPMAKGYKMQMGVKEIDSPGAFSTKQSKIMQMSPLLNTQNENGFELVDTSQKKSRGVEQGLKGTYTDTIKTFEKPGESSSPSYESADPGLAPGGEQATDLDKYFRDLYARFGDDVTTQSLIDNKYIAADMADAYNVVTGGKNVGKLIQNGGDDSDSQQKQEKTRTFEADPFQDTYNPFEARQEQRNITASARKDKRAEIKRARAQKKAAKDFTAEEAKAAGLDLGEFAGLTGKDARKQMKKARKAAKLKAKITTEKGRKGVTDAVSEQISQRKNPTKTGSFQYEPNSGSGSDYKSVFSDAAKRIGNMDSSLGNTDFSMPMKPMQFRKVAYSGRKPGKSGYKK